MRSILIGLTAQLGLAAAFYINYGTSGASVGVDGTQVTINFGQRKPCKDDMMKTDLIGGSDMMSDPDMSKMATAAQNDRGSFAGTGWNQSRSYLTFVHTSGQAYSNYWKTGAGWSGWTSMGGDFDRTLAVTQFNDNVYTVGVDVYGSLLIKSRNDTGFFPKTNSWIYLGGGYIGTPAISSLTNTTVDVVAKKLDGTFDHINYNPVDDKIVGPTSLGGNFTGLPDLTYANLTSTGALHVFGIDATTSQMWYKNTTGSSWNKNWISLGGESFTSSPTAISLGSRIDVVAHNKNGTFSSKTKMDATQDWSTTWMNGGSGGKTTSSPTAVWWTAGGQPLLDVWYQTTVVQQSRYSPKGWSTYNIGGALISNPTVMTWGGSRLELWGIGTNGVIYYRFYNGGWSEWSAFGNGGKVA